jgi:error-prone DNA polymerase
MILRYCRCIEERLVADYAGTGLTTDRHPMHQRRPELRQRGVQSAEELKHCRDGEFVRAAGCIIARQRPGTAKGFIFISMEDETGIANVIVTPDLYDRDRLIVTRSKFLLVEGKLQNQDGVIHIKPPASMRSQTMRWRCSRMIFIESAELTIEIRAPNF